MIPADLEAFWNKTRARAAAEPLGVELVPLPEVTRHALHHQYRITYRSLDGVRVRAYLSVSSAERDNTGKLPAIITAPGYSGWGAAISLADCMRGYVILHIYPRGQGESAELWRVKPGAECAWVNHGKHNPEGFYYQGAYMDLVRGVDYLRTRPDVDPERIGLWGGSQSGGMALAVGALDARVKAVVANVPYLCDFRHNEAYKSCPDLVNDPVFLDTFDYFDPVNLAPWLKAPTLVSSGGRDATCPPAAIRAVWDRLSGIKSLYHDPDMGHDSWVDFNNKGWEWMKRYL